MHGRGVKCFGLAMGDRDQEASWGRSNRSPHELFHFLKENFDRKISVSLPWISRYVVQS